MQFNNNNNQMPNIPIAAPPQQPTQSGFVSIQPQQNYAPPVLTCSLCKCQSVENNRWLNCGQILDIVPIINLPKTKNGAVGTVFVLERMM